MWLRPKEREMQQKPEMPGEGESHLSPPLPHVWLGRTEKADASWVHCQEGPRVDTGYGKEDSDSLWKKNNSTPHEDGLALEESPRKMKGSLSWQQTSAGQGLCHLIEL